MIHMNCLILYLYLLCFYVLLFECDPFANLFGHVTGALYLSDGTTRRAVSSLLPQATSMTCSFSRSRMVTTTMQLLAPG